MFVFQFVLRFYEGLFFVHTTTYQESTVRQILVTNCFARIFYNGLMRNNKFPETPVAKFFFKNNFKIVQNKFGIRVLMSYICETKTK